MCLGLSRLFHWSANRMLRLGLRSWAASRLRHADSCSDCRGQRRHLDELGATQPQRVLLFLALRFRDQDQRPVTSRAGDHRKADPGIAGGRFHHEAIGNTPLIKLKRASEQTGCTILGKAEFMNPGQSVKDRAGKQMILEAEKRGELSPAAWWWNDRRQYRHRPGGGRQCPRLSHADPHPGNAEPGKEGHAAAVRRRARRGAGAALFQSEQLSACRTAAGRQLRKTEPNGVLFADQWNNLDNAKAHYESTGPEIWEQTGGKIDGFICSVGTGGTLAGTSRYLKEKHPGIVNACADPHGFAMYELFKNGTPNRRRATRSPKASGSAASRRSLRPRRSTTPS